jgi:uncharacterized membrane protein YkvA (DUF1232 family)
MDKHEDFYKNLREKMREWIKSKNGKDNKFAEYLMFAPDLFHLVCKLSIDNEVPIKEKAKLVGVIAYYLSPLDLVPEALVGPAGYVDDIALAAYVLNGLINNTNPEVVIKHWAGDGDVLNVIQQIIKVADNMVGSGLWKKLKAMF